MYKLRAVPLRKAKEYVQKQKEYVHRKGICTISTCTRKSP